MYECHLRDRPGNPNIGWLRSMYHGLIQQIVRQSPAYYLAYVMLRPDHASKFISYPYYSKSQKAGQSAGFRHIDLNIPKLVNESKGANMIQGSVSLSTEDPTDCTELLLGMHKHLGKWWSDFRIICRGTHGKQPDGWSLPTTRRWHYPGYNYIVTFHT